MEKTLSQMWDLMDFSQQPTLSQTASIWVKISYLTIRKADFWFGGLLKHLSVRAHARAGTGTCAGAGAGKGKEKAILPNQGQDIYS